MSLASDGIIIESLRMYIGLQGLYLGDNIYIPFWILVLIAIGCFFLFIKILRVRMYKRTREKNREKGYEHTLNQVWSFSKVKNIGTMRPITMVANEKCIGFIDPLSVDKNKVIEVPLEMIASIQILTADDVPGYSGLAGSYGDYHADSWDAPMPNVLKAPRLKRNGETTKRDMSQLYILVNYNKLGRKTFDGKGILISAYNENKKQTRAYVEYVKEKLKAFPNRKYNKKSDIHYEI